MLFYILFVRNAYFKIMRIAKSCKRLGKRFKTKRSGLRLMQYANLGLLFFSIFAHLSAIFAGETHRASTLATMDLKRAALQE